MIRTPQSPGKLGKQRWKKKSETQRKHKDKRGDQRFLARDDREVVPALHIPLCATLLTRFTGRLVTHQ